MAQRKLLFIAILTALMSYGVVYGAADSNLIAYWRLDETGGSTAEDSAGSNDGTVYGAQWTDGYFGGALNFDGDGDYVRIPPIILDDFTISFWVTTEQDPPDSSQWYNGAGLVDAEKRNVHNDWGTSLIDDGKVAFGIGNPDTTIKSLSLINDGTWYFVTATREKNSGEIVLYINSLKESEGIANTQTLNGIDYIGIGNNSSDVRDNDEWFEGVIDDVRIYNRVLSAGEIEQLYEEGFGSGFAIRQVNDVLDSKFETLGVIDADIADERQAYDALEELLESADYGDLAKADIIKAKQRIHSAIQHEEQAYTDIEKSIEQLLDGLEALGTEYQPQADSGGSAAEAGGIIAAGGQEPILTGGEYPACWDYPTQCYGDADGSGSVDTPDWPVFRDGFSSSYPDTFYINCACADFDRDGDIDSADWPEFRDWFSKQPPADCPQGDINGIFKP